MEMLFSPIKIGKMSIKNRFVRSATQDWLGDDDGHMTERSLACYEELAKNDVGLIMTAHAYVEHPRGRAAVKQNAIYDDAFIADYWKLAKAVHAHGARLVLQAAHAGVQTTRELTQGVAPADPAELPEADIDTIIAAFVAAAGRAKEAGCDGVQFHLAHGYLLSRFLSPVANTRTDAWGGSTAKRMNIIRAIVTRAKALVGDDFPLLVKLNTMGGFEGTAAITVEEAVRIAAELERLGVAAIEVSGGVVSEPKNSLSWTGILHHDQEAYFANNARRIKAAVSIPVILVGGLRSRCVMEKVLADGTADLVAMSRPFVREPDLVRRLANGQEKAACCSCNRCRDFNGIHCVFNKK